MASTFILVTGYFIDLITFSLVVAAEQRRSYAYWEPGSSQLKTMGNHFEYGFSIEKRMNQNCSSEDRPSSIDGHVSLIDEAMGGQSIDQGMGQVDEGQKHTNRSKSTSRRSTQLMKVHRSTRRHRRSTRSPEILIHI